MKTAWRVACGVGVFLISVQAASAVYIKVTASNPVPLYVDESFNISGSARYSSPDFPVSGAEVTITLLSSNYSGNTVVGGLYSLAIAPFAAAGVYTARVYITDSSVSGTNFLAITVSSPVPTNADLAVSKSSTPSPVIAGSNLTYTVTVTNRGPAAVTSCVVTDSLPVGVSPSGLYVTNLGALAAGSATSFSLTVLVLPASSGAITNVARVAGNLADTNASDNVATCVTPVSTDADLSIALTAIPSLVPLGSNVTYTLSVSNAGPVTATSVVVTDTLPAVVSFVSASSSQGSVTNAGGIVSAALGDMSPGAMAVVTIYASGATLGVGTNFARVTATQPDAVPANNVTSLETRVEAFTEVPVSVPGLQVANLVRWGDYDGDGYPDFLLSGLTTAYTSLLYRSVGGTSFSEEHAPLTVAFEGSGSWGDYDRDGDLDLALGGDDVNPRVARGRLYQNDGDGGFTVAQVLFEEPYERPPFKSHIAATAWGDYDNDGDLDLVYSGEDSNTNDFVHVLRNDAGIFTNSGVALQQGLVTRQAEWGDYDVDGDLDLFVMSYQGGTYYFHLYRNDGADSFASVATPVTPVYGEGVWGDYDNDGDLDLLLAGHTAASVRRADIYENLGGGVFTNINAGLAGVGAYGASVDWGDYDSDGDLDALLAGLSPSRICKIYRNDGGNVFTDIGATINPVKPGSSRWADADRDGDLDFLLAGDDVVRLFRNELNGTNDLPQPPTGLVGAVDGSNVVLQWHRSTDSETPAAGLTYNLRVGSYPGGIDLCSPEVTTDGVKLVYSRGNVGSVTNWTLHGLTNGDYFWSVQAVDASYAASLFSTGGQFRIGPLPSADLAVSVADAPDPVLAGSNLAYTIIVTNLGPDAATNVVLSGTLPAGVLPGGNILTNLGSIAAQGSRTVSVIVTVNTGVVGVITQHVDVASAILDPELTNNAASAVTVVWSPEAELTLSLSGPAGPVSVGSTGTYVVFITNLGPRVASDVIVTNVMPACAVLQSAVASQGTCTQAGDVVTCDLGVIGIGASASITIEVVTTSVPPPLLYGVIEDGYLLPGGEDFYIVDPADGDVLAAMTLNRPTQEVNAGWALATHPVSGELWALLDAPGEAVPERYLATVDPVSGLATLVGYPGHVLSDLAFASDGQLYGIADADGPQLGTLYLLDQADASATPVVTLNEDSMNDSIAFDPVGGLLYHRHHTDTNFQSIHLQTLQVTTIPICEECDTSLSISSMTYLRPGEFIASSDVDTGWYVLTTDGNETLENYPFFYFGGLAFGAHPALFNRATVSASQPDPVPANNAAWLGTEVTDPNPDRDRDGLPDDWEQDHFGHVTAGIPLEDVDGDGMDNRSEFLTGTAPGDDTSVFELRDAGAGDIIRWRSESNMTYRLDISTNLIDGFVPLQTNIPATPPDNVYTDAIPHGASRYYRVIAE